MKKKKLLRKVLVVVMALTMVFTMSGGVFATTTNVTAVNDSMYHNFANIVTDDNGNVSYTNAAGNSITSFTVAASQAGTYWQAIGFNSSEDATDVVWSSSDTSIATVPVSGQAVASVSGTEGTYDSQNTVTLVGTEAGSCSIQATFDGGSVNFTITLEKTSANVTGVRVIVEDKTTNGSIMDDMSALTVSKAIATSAFYGQAQAAQSFATAGTALETLTAAKGYTLTVGYQGSYVSSINGVGPDSTYTNGWNYCVMRQDEAGIWEIAEDSLVIGAAEYKVKSGDVVYWVYAPYSEVAQCNAEKCMKLNGLI